MQLDPVYYGENGRVINLDTPSIDCAAMSDYWRSASDLLVGLEALRSGKERYLPKFARERKADYDYRLSVSGFSNIWRDTVEDLSSRPFSEPVKTAENLPEQFDDFLIDVDGAGSDLTMFAIDTMFNGIALCVDWIFVDYPYVPVSPNKPRSIAQEKALGLRPYWSHVRAPNVLEVQSKNTTGAEHITFFRMVEWIDDVRHVRMFKLYPGIDGETDRVEFALYKQTKQSNSGKLTEWVLVTEAFITIPVIPMVPFYTGRRKGRSWQFFPPMRDALDLQLSLFQDETDLAYTKKLSAYPMLAAEGVVAEKDAQGKPKQIDTGPGMVLYGGIAGNGTAGTFKYVEPAATSLTFLSGEIEKKQKQLRELGRQPLTAQSGNLTVITAAVAAQKGNSAVQMWAIEESRSLDAALTITAMLFGIDPDGFEPEAHVDREFEVDGSNNEQINALNTMREKGDLSQETYWKEMQKRKVLSADFDAEDERKALLKEVPGDEDNPNDDPNDPPLPKKEPTNDPLPTA